MKHKSQTKFYQAIKNLKCYYQNVSNLPLPQQDAVAGLKAERKTINAQSQDDNHFGALKKEIVDYNS